MRLCKIGIILILTILLAVGCDNDHTKPTNPDQTDQNPPVSTVTILVDRNDPNAVSAPCGSVNAVCKTITDGILSAAQVREGIPTVLISPGTYDAEPVYPIRVMCPVILKRNPDSSANLTVAEQAFPVKIAIPELAGGMLIQSAEVTIEGLFFETTPFTYEPGGYSATAVIETRDGGKLVMRNSQIQSHNWTSYALDIWNNGAEIEDSIIEGDITTGGNLSIKNSTIRTTFFFHLLGGSIFLDHNIIWGGLYQEFPTDRTEISHNTIYGGFCLGDGRATLVGNTIIDANGSLTISVYAYETEMRRLTLTDNVIFGHKQPLWFEGPLTLSLSGNRIDTDTPGTVAIECDNSVTVKTDGTNTLRNPRSWVKCDGLPPAPETNPF